MGDLSKQILSRNGQIVSKMTSLSRYIDELEETLIALLLGAMALITFANVLARYLFQTNILWALEATVFLFAWLVLMGMSYCVKHSLHLGVDIVINSVGPRTRRILAIISVLCCLAYCLLLLKGCWDYWYPFMTKNAWYEVDDIPLANSMQFLSQWFNEGEKYEKIPKFIPYFVLPLGAALLTFRFLEAGYRIICGAQNAVITRHEAEQRVDALIDTVVDKTPPKERKE